MAELQKSPWPGWKTVRLIGRGSFGTVYEIQRELVDGTVESAAMKVITIPQNPDDIEEMYGDGLDEESITETFHEHLKNIVAEYTLMRKLDGSANVVSCKDISYIQHNDGIGWDIFIRMELLTPLLKSLPEHIDEKTAVKIGRDICSALVLCKKYGIIHRDIKPQNIFVSTSGDYKLGDFGIAKTVEKTMGGTKIGTYKYMAPEVYNNQPYGSAADIYSLGLVLYWLLNERRMPFMPLPPAKILAGQDEAARQRRLSGEPLLTPAHGSTELKRIVLKACAYDPKERYHTADEMLADLNALEGGRAITKTNDSCCWNEGDTTEITDETAAETIGVFETDRKKAAAESNHSCKFENDALDTSTDETAQTVGISWKNGSQPVEKPDEHKKRKSGKIRTSAIILILIFGVCGIYGYMNCWFGHRWKEATYDKPKTCQICGIITGTSLKDDLDAWVEGDWTWSLNENGVLTISGMGNMGNFSMENLENLAPWHHQREMITCVVVEEGITGIGVQAFACCSKLSDVSLPHSLRIIRENAFFGYGNELKKLEIPEGVVYIGNAAFGASFLLESVSIPSSVVTLGGNPFVRCLSLTQIKVSQDNRYFKAVDDVLLSKDMKTLFCYPVGKQGTTYEIPASVNKIFDSAFIGCYSLTDVFYSGSKNQWDKLIKGNGVEGLDNCTIHYSSN